MSQWYHISHLSSPAQLGGGAAGCQTHRAGPAHGSSPPHGTHDADKLNSYKTEGSGLAYFSDRPRRRKARGAHPPKPLS